MIELALNFFADIIIGSIESPNHLLLKEKRKELNPGLPRDRRGYKTLY